jgi:hypothetical protein
MAAPSMAIGAVRDVGLFGLLMSGPAIAAAVQVWRQP